MREELSMKFILTLVQNLPNRTPSALEVVYRFNDGTEHNWPVTPDGPDQNRAVIKVDSTVNLINQMNVKSRVLRTHYPTAPDHLDTQISSVQPGIDEPAQAPSERRGTDEFGALGKTPYSVTIIMTQETVNKLNAGNYVLYGFKAVKTTAGNGAPLVWFKTTSFGLSTNVSWAEQFEAYTSKSQIIPNGHITATNPYEIDLGSTLDVETTSGTGSIDTQQGVPLAISIYNETTTEFTCGISQRLADGTTSPMCAFPLYGQGLDVIAPIEQVLIMFSTLPVNLGTVIEQAYSPAILIDLTGDNSREVAYEINQGWSWGGEPWAQAVKAKADLVPLLIQSSAALARRRLEALGV
jgi:hypothetical protein